MILKIDATEEPAVLNEESEPESSNDWQQDTNVGSSSSEESLYENSFCAFDFWSTDLQIQFYALILPLCDMIN